MIDSCDSGHFVILKSIFLPKTGGMQLHSWTCSGMVFYYLVDGSTRSRLSLNERRICRWQHKGEDQVSMIEGHV